MADVPKIGEVERPVNEALVAGLRELLRRAEAGEVLGFAGCFELTGREIGTAISGDFGPFQMVGALEALKMQIAHKRIEGVRG